VTRRERGIPIKIFHDMVKSVGFEIVRERRCMFSGIGKLAEFTGTTVYNSSAWLLVDTVLCSFFAWNTKYHPTRAVEKLAPTSVFFVLRKPRSMKTPLIPQ